MNTIDLRIQETFDGGDVVFLTRDLQTIFGLQNMPYIAMFGGNPGYPTTGPKNTKQAFDWWGNYLFHPDDKKLWFNSKTEHILSTVALNPATRIEIENAVKADLAFMNDFAIVNVNVILVSIDRVRIEITITEPDNLQTNTFQYIWDATEQELSDPAYTVGSAPQYNHYIDNYIDNYFQ